MKVDIVSAYETDVLIRTKDSRTDWVLCVWFKSDNGKLSAETFILRASEI